MNLDRLMERTRPLRRLPVAARYLLSVVVVGAFFALRLMLSALDGFPYLLFFPAIILCAVVLDRGTGFFATVLSALLAVYFFVPPIGSFAVPDGSTMLALVLFVLTGFFLAAVVEALRVTAETLKETKHELETSKAQTELLLVDINHRVKNHLQSLAWLLTLSRRDAGDERSKEALDAAAGRIRSWPRSTTGCIYWGGALPCGPATSWRTSARTSGRASSACGPSCCGSPPRTPTWTAIARRSWA